MRTFAKSSSCDALKIRWRSRRTFLSSLAQLMPCQSSSGSSSGPFTVPVSAASNLPIGSGPFPPFLQGSTWSTSAPFRAGHPPVSSGLCASPQSRSSRFPLTFRPTGLRFLDHPVPAAASGSLTGDLLLEADHNGVPTFHSIKMRLGRVPPLPRARWCPCRPAFV
ncbi:hypothetical protein SMALA_5408 [Streptomyces malaysiensis subsp. malaysiensis]|nr:hypothetical protein SMALA_2316 [Streptomyces malaysiensis]ATL85638.1 hypothetical protein SMALA_5408 [Streptomyces malaysiensis]